MNKVLYCPDVRKEGPYIRLMVGEEIGIPGINVFGWRDRRVAEDILPNHHHQNRFEIVYTCSGSPFFGIGEEKYSLSGGDVFLTRPWQPHSSGSQVFSVSEIYWMQVELAQTPGALFLSDEARLGLNQRLMSLSSPLIHTDLTHMKRLMQGAYRALTEGSNPQLAAQFISLFLYELVEYDHQAAAGMSPDMERAVNYILEHIEEKLSLEALAGLCFLSLSQFKQKFKQQVGMSPRQFINDQKIRQAKKMLRAGCTAAETAAKLNFDNFSYFITVFKRYTSMPPGAFREKAMAQAEEKQAVMEKQASP